jgi:hypothetical protein
MSERRGDWMQTYTGRQFWPLDPYPEDLSIVDIAHQLSMRVRYGGATTRFYSVAEHCVIVSRHVPPEFALEALLHDASEAYLGDMIRPLKRQPDFAAFCAIEAVLERMIYEHYGVAPTVESHAAVKIADNRILADERINLMAPPPKPWIETEPPLGVEIEGLYSSAAKAAYLARFDELRGWGHLCGFGEVKP